MATMLQLLYIMCLLCTRVIGYDKQVRLTEISWSIRRMVAGGTASRRNLGMVVIPCIELTAEEHLNRFVRRFLSNANVDYNATRVALWYGNKLVDDQISRHFHTNSYCSLTDRMDKNFKTEINSRSSYRNFNRQRGIDPLESLEVTLFNPDWEDVLKQAVIIHCGVNLFLSPRLLQLQQEHNLLTISLVENPDEALFAAPNGHYIKYPIEFEELASKAFYADVQKSEYSEAQCPCFGASVCRCDRRTGGKLCLCKPGFYRETRRDTCRACPANTYKPDYGNGGETPCLPCPDINQEALPGSSSRQDCLCKDGFQAREDNRKCRQVRCPRLLKPANGYFVGGQCDTAVNAACGVRCDTGYEVDGSSVRLCQSNGKWSGSVASCQVRQCGKLRPPRHGSMKCAGDEFSYGTICKFSCSEGYTLLGAAKRSCLSIGHWSGIQTYCRDVSCPPLPAVLNGVISPALCSQELQKYGSSCMIACETGYELDGSALKQCTNTGQWTLQDQSWKCVDIEPPHIECPDNVTVTAGDEFTTLVPLIPLPKIRDRSSILSTVRLPAQLKQRFPIGETEVTYMVEDVWGNIAQCAFTITVVDETPPRVDVCVPPLPSIAPLYARVNLTTPQFSDNSQLFSVAPRLPSTVAMTPSMSIWRERLFVQPNTILRHVWPYGSTPVEFQAEDESGNKNTCTYNVTVIELLDLCYRTADVHDATFHCEQEHDTTAICSLGCDPGYTLAHEINQENILCVNGEINPPFIPDCTEEKPLIYQWMIESSYSFEHMCDSTNEIMESIDMVTEMLHEQLRMVCTDLLDCNATLDFYDCAQEIALSDIFVEYVISVSPRIIDGMPKQQAYVKVIETVRVYASNTSMSLPRHIGKCGITLKYPIAPITSPQLCQFAIETIQFLEAFLSSGLFALIGPPIGFQSDVIFHGSSGEFVCPPGSISRDRACVACPRGTFANTREKSCAICPKGTFSETIGSTYCQKCPDKFSTQQSGAKHRDMCKEECPAGMYSPEGLNDLLKPCQSCVRGTYQPRRGQSKCLPCYSNYTTLFMGASSVSQCKKLCPPGQISQSGLYPCVSCPIHSYQSDAGKSYCLLCQSGMVSRNPGSISQSQCNLHVQENDIKLFSYMSDEQILPYSECFHNPCLRNSTCYSLYFGFYCHCWSGFAGTFCEIDINECHSSPCMNGAVCHDLVGRFSCECLPGWTGSLCEIDIEECDSSPCLNDGSCIDMLGAYDCLCHPGFNGTHCEIDLDDCASSPCQNQGVCIDGANSYLCECLPGYEGLSCQVEIDECESNPCWNRGTCINTPGSFRCMCYPGFEDEFCSTNIDECAEQPCQNDAVCEDGINSFECYCTPAFGGIFCENVMESQFILEFDGDPTNYAAINISSQDSYSSLSVSFWMISEDTTHLGTPFSYAVNEFTNAFTLTDYSGFILYVNDETVFTDLSLNDGVWHHVAITWQSSDGAWQFFVDGKLVDGGTSVSTNQPVQGGGTFIIGQEQDNELTTFNAIESFVGQMNMLHVWDDVLPPQEVLAMATFCEDFAGTVLAWPELQFKLNGDIQLLNSSFCAACVRPDDIAHGEVVWSDTLTAGMALYSCEEGYTMVGIGQRSCRVTGSWSGNKPQCMRVFCPPTPEFSDTVVSVEGLEYGMTAQYSCTDDYIGFGELTCGPEGKWIGQEPECTRITCPSPESEALLVQTSKADYFAGDIVTLTCGGEHILIGNNTITCDWTGYWLPELPLCKPDTTCKDIPPQIPGATHITSKDLDIVTITYRCSAGYRPVNDADDSITCIQRKWEKPLFACELVECPEFQFTEGMVNLTGYDHRAGDSIKISCNIGYILVGAREVSCLLRGAWSDVSTVCQRIYCPHPALVDNGKAVQLKPEYFPGDEVEYICTTGYRLEGYSTPICDETGSWSHPPPVCDPITCLEFFPIVHGDLSTEATLYGTNVTFTCHTGYFLRGVYSTVCTAEGIWSEEPPECLPVECPRPATIPQGYVRGADVTYESIVEYSCVEGYILSGAETIKCTEQAVWDLPYPQCMKIQCTDLPSFFHGAISSVDKTYGTRVRFTCDIGFKLIGAHETECSADKSWSYPPPVCQMITCPSISTPRNGTVASTSHEFNSTLKFACNEGFYMEGSEKRTCLVDGNWSGQDTLCHIVTCSSPDEALHGSWLYADLNFGSNLQLICDRGYELNERVTLMCQNNGTWSDTYPFCQEIRCPRLAKYVPHGVISYNSSVFNSRALVHCDRGYTRKMMYMTCEDDSQWWCHVDGENSRCRDIVNVCGIVHCDAPLHIVHAHIIFPLELVYDNYISYACVFGYKLTGSDKLRCTADGTWDEPVPQCHPITCTLPNDNLPDYLHIISPKDSITVNSSISFRCSIGYRLQGEPVSICTMHSNWTHPLPECKPILCPTLDPPAHGALTTYDEELSYGAMIEFRCRKGYKLEGFQMLSCGPEGDWSASRPECLKSDCDPPGVLVHGRVTFKSLTQGSRLRYSCDTGYILMGEDNSTCMPENQWSSAMPSCSPVVCPVIYPPANGHVTGNNSFSSTIIFTCDRGYFVDGYDRNYCQANGSWLYDTNPACKMKQCSPPKMLEHGHWINLSDESQGEDLGFEIGTVLVPSCEDGYALKELDWTNLICSDDQIWTGIIPLCTPIECPPVAVTNGQIQGNSQRHLSMIRVSCDTGYTLTTDIDTLQCQSDESWGNVIPECNIINCGPPPLLGNGSVQTDLTTYNNTARYVCNRGFRLVGVSLSLCTESGAWINRLPPLCQEITCQHPGPIANGRLYGRSAMELLVGERIVVVCNIGYELNGAIVSKCTENGTWSSGMPRCNPIVCPKLRQISHGRVSWQSLHFKSVAKYECRDGYELIGSNQRLCLASKNWNNDEPVCSLKLCKDPPVIANGFYKQHYMQQLSPGAEVNVQCNGGYLLQGDAVLKCSASLNWPIMLPVCVRICSNPFTDISNAYLPKQTNYTLGDVATLACLEGYYPLQTDGLRCQASGVWTESNVTCQPVPCLLEVSPNMVINSNTTPVYGESIGISCLPGYFMYPNSSEIECLANGTMSPPVPVCEPIDCGTPKLTENLMINSTFSLYESVVSFSCKDGHTLIGSHLSVCHSNGLWYPPVPFCTPVKCHPAKISNGRMDRNEYSFGDIARIICDEGQRINGPKEVICSSDSSWNPKVSDCSSVSCAEIPIVPHTVLVSATASSYLYQDVVTFRCADGYEPENEDIFITCLSTGQWSQPVIECTKIMCMLPDTMHNMNMELSAHDDGFTVSFACLNGYTLVGTPLLHCQAGGQWSDELPQCQLLICQSTSPKNLTNGSYTIVNQHGIRQAQYHCREGYEMSDTNVSSLVLCNEKNGWPTPDVSCASVHCPVLVPGEELEISSASTVVGANVKFSCTIGYQLDGENTTICQTSGEWQHALPVCVPRHCVHPLPTLDHGYVIVQDYLYGSFATVTCDSGYHLIGSSSIYCQSDGRWSAIASYCREAECPRMYNVPNGRLTSTSRHPGDKMTVSCDRGFKPDTRHLVCLENGAWDPPMPSCEALEVCPLPPKPDGAYSRTPRAYYAGERARFTCKLGYTGSIIFMCENNGQWSTLEGECRSISCERPETDGLARIHGSQYGYRSIVAYTCPFGYRRTGSAFLMCKSDGSWSDSAACITKD